MSTAPIEQGLVDANVRGLLYRLQARADNAYCAYIGLCRRDECLGREAKVEERLFGDAELKSHKDAAEWCAANVFGKTNCAPVVGNADANDLLRKINQAYPR